MFETVLIANRGEIACRVIRTLRRLGIRSVAVHSDADRTARHVVMADAAYRIGPAPAAKSYLRADAILEAAAQSGAEAIHPGYGFLAENASFARACEAAGRVFIGPGPEAIEAMGAKDRAKALMAEAGVPLVPGYQGDDQDGRHLLEAALEVGFPLLIKAAAGGGGKGMRVVRRAEDFAAALEGAKREAGAAFGDERMLLERYLEGGRHVEVQVFGDDHGNVVHLFERDCSLQRRHQKVLEEAPAPGLSAEQREFVGSTAVRAAKAIGYANAGTVEFLMDRARDFFFLEMNTRLQVEHPVTEMITGQDLVEWQLRVAAGEPLPLGQEAIGLHGHAIEARLYAEDPGRGFLPSTGHLFHLRLPEGEGLRIETGVAQGDEVSPYYDPMIAKVVAWGESRDAALRRLAAALDASLVVGPQTNVALLLRVLGHEEVRRGRIDTGFLQAHEEALLAPEPPPDDELILRACLWLLAARRREAADAAAGGPDPHSPWHRVDGWRLNDRGHQTLRLRVGERALAVDAVATGDGWRLMLDGRVRHGRAWPDASGATRVELDGRAGQLGVVRHGSTLHVFGDGGRARLELVDPLAEAEPAEGAEGLLSAPMPGKIIRRLVAAGARVGRGQPLLVLEAMKMEHTITAPADGAVRALHYDEGDQVEEGAVLLDFEEAGD
jgi:3-methylcrotonyl-CoA carboxylase alpha subunit